MDQLIHFLGLGIEGGQPRGGLHRSPSLAREFLPALQRASGLQFVDEGDISPMPGDAAKVHSPEDLKGVDWKPYQQGLRKIRDLLQKKNGPVLNWGGDHSVALSTVGAFCEHAPQGSVVWIDAHADLNLPCVSPTGNLHGMPLSVLLDLGEIKTRHFPWIQGCLNPTQLIYVGLRDLDPFEQQTLLDLNITAYPAPVIRRRGMAAVAREIFARVQGRPLHISFDIDSLSPEVAPSTGVPVAEGLLLPEVEILGRELSRHPDLTSMDVVEINPALGTAQDVRQTYLAAFKVVASVFSAAEPLFYSAPPRTPTP